MPYQIGFCGSNLCISTCKSSAYLIEPIIATMASLA